MSLLEKKSHPGNKSVNIFSFFLFYKSIHQFWCIIWICPFHYNPYKCFLSQVFANFHQGFIIIVRADCSLSIPSIHWPLAWASMSGCLRSKSYSVYFKLNSQFISLKSCFFSIPSVFNGSLTNLIMQASDPREQCAEARSFLTYESQLWTFLPTLNWWHHANRLKFIHLQGNIYTMETGKLYNSALLIFEIFVCLFVCLLESPFTSTSLGTFTMKAILLFQLTSHKSGF